MATWPPCGRCCGLPNPGARLGIQLRRSSRRRGGSVQNLESELAYFIRKLGQTFAEEVSQGRALPDGAIATLVNSWPMPLLDDEKAWLIRELEQSFTTSQARGASVFSDFRPWLRERRDAIDFYYWNRLRRYYLEGAVIPPQVV